MGGRSSSSARGGVITWKKSDYDKEVSDFKTWIDGHSDAQGTYDFLLSDYTNDFNVAKKSKNQEAINKTAMQVAALKSKEVKDYVEYKVASNANRQAYKDRKIDVATYKQRASELNKKYNQNY